MAKAHMPKDVKASSKKVEGKKNSPLVTEDMRWTYADYLRSTLPTYQRSPLLGSTLFYSIRTGVLSRSGPCSVASLSPVGNCG